MSFLDIKGLSVSVEGKPIIADLDLQLAKGEVCVIMGPNGSGKSTLVNAIMGHPNYQITSGSIVFHDRDITMLAPEERAALGLFLSFQQPREIGGVDYYPFLFEAYKSLSLARRQEPEDVFSFKQSLDEKAKQLGVASDWGQRYLNVGFSGGEKKKSEILQLALFSPSLAIFDEIDSGLDIDALELVGHQIAEFITPLTGALVVTHYPKILKYIPVSKVIVMTGGKIVASGGQELVKRLEGSGFSDLAEVKN